VHLNGRHPYLTSHELDYQSRDVELSVAARDWNHAAEVAMDAARNLPDKWSWFVTAIDAALSQDTHSLPPPQAKAAKPAGEITPPSSPVGTNSEVQP